MNTHHYRIKLGRHRGELITRVPVDYLKWMANTPTHAERAYAQAELARRGTVTPEFEVSGHAVDRASQSCLSIWKQTRREGEGLHAWLCRVGSEALTGKQKKGGKFAHMGMLFAFAQDGTWPVLKTVMPDKPHKGERHELDLAENNQQDHSVQANPKTQEKSTARTERCAGTRGPAITEGE